MLAPINPYSISFNFTSRNTESIISFKSFIVSITVLSVLEVIWEIIALLIIFEKCIVALMSAM